MSSVNAKKLEPATVRHKADHVDSLRLKIQEPLQPIRHLANLVITKLALSTAFNLAF